METSKHSIFKLIQAHTIISDQMNKKRLTIILNQLKAVLDKDIDGAIVEFGCYSGTTSLFIRRLLNSYGVDREFHVYDSFEGLPAKTIEDASVAGSEFKAGELKASKHEIIRNFKKSGLRPPIIHKGWFSELGAKDLPSEIVFGFIDGDFYRSVNDSLKSVWPRLVKGGAVVVDDYMRPQLPGATRAVDEFFLDINIKVKNQSNLAIITKN
ncbi:MAG: TylF/MycF/NovP-related O-methyltransferase [Candidatus Saccharimonadales bacterium]